VKKLIAVTAALAAAVAVLVVVSLPQRRLALPPRADATIPGILHVHTNRSDGRSSPDDVAAAAARAGLKFLVFTDHGDATRTPDPPTYRSGVLCLDGVEISTSGGHYIALDMPAAPYPLAGEPRDVVDDVKRLGGFGIAAHPDSPKPELRWQAWEVPFDGVELINPDTSWRLWAQQAATGSKAASGDRWRARRQLALSLLDYPVRPAESIARLLTLDPEDSAAELWSAIVSRRRLVAIAGIDAHAMLGLRGDPETSYSLPLPGYESSFRVMSVHAAIGRPLSGNAPDDARALIRAIRMGHLYVALDGVATPPSFEITATNEHGTVHEGDELAVGGPVTLHVRSNAPQSFTTTVWNGANVMSGGHHEPEFDVQAPANPGAYWVEIQSTGRSTPLTWLRSNPIYVRGSAPSPQPSVARVSESRAIFDGRSIDGWRAEHDSLSAGAVELAGSAGTMEARFRFGLAGGAATGQFSALVYDFSTAAFDADRVTFTIRAERPMRISVQLRGGDGVVDRWQRSVYVDSTVQDRVVSFDDCLPVGTTRTPRAPAGHITSLMFVVDTTNSKTGLLGRLWLRKAVLERISKDTR
jgi:hypothetical protein